MAKSPGSWASRNFLLGQCDALIAVSEFVARILREGAREPESPEAERHVRPPIRGDFSKIHVIYGGIDTRRFFPTDASDKRRELGLEPGEHAFAVAGGFDLPRGKGQRDFLAAAARIHKEIPHARFLIIGRGSMAEVLTHDIERLGLQGKARLTGQVSDMPQVMNAIDCLVHPQIGTEALGLVICDGARLRQNRSSRLRKCSMASRRHLPREVTGGSSNPRAWRYWQTRCEARSASQKQTPRNCTSESRKHFLSGLWRRKRGASMQLFSGDLR